jgi:phenylalanyl-tRNA synthetase beta chain
MKFPVSWLRDFVAIECSITDLVDRLTMAGLEVDSVDYVGEKLSGIITGRIDSIEKHPDADKLVITSIFDGKNHHQIVTGASNITVGDIVPVSLPGATLANGMTIKESKLRGIPSNGMLCSEEECGVAEKSNGIWILPKDTALGIDFIEFACLNDVVLDISILPNRGDCQSMLGLAREIAAITNQSFRLPEIKLTESDIPHDYSVSLQTPVCPLYTGRYITALKNGTSPIWMLRRLQLCGIRPISIIVDITNYVLLETGHPLHAFDDALCNEKSVIVNDVDKETTIKTLDDIDRTLQSGMAMISLANTPVAVAGIMGGKSTEVSETTTDIFLEAAYFDPISIRRTAQALGLRTESSIRFEKGVPADTVDYASQRAAELFTNLAGGKISKHVITQKQADHSCFKQLRLEFSLDQINSFLGSSFSQQDIEAVLLPLGFIFEGKDIIVPRWRSHDIKEWTCISEEIARSIGFDAIPSTLPTSLPLQDTDDPLVEITTKIQDFLVSNGFNEITTYPMISEKEYELLGLGAVNDANQLANPISDQLSVMRSSLLPSMLPIISYHTTRQLPNQALFEIGKTFHNDHEITALGICMSGVLNLEAYTPSLRDQESKLFEYLTHTAQRLLSFLGVKITLKKDIDASQSWKHPQLSYTLFADTMCLGTITHIHPEILDFYTIKDPVVFLELSLNGLISCLPTMASYQAFSRFPSTRRDVALCIPDTIEFADIMTVINKYKHKSVVKTGVFDVFESESLAPFKRSIGIYFIYQSKTETLSDEGVNRNHQRLCDRLTESLPIQIR